MECNAEGASPGLDAAAEDQRQQLVRRGDMPPSLQLLAAVA
jgi:hypothetical protein